MRLPLRYRTTRHRQAFTLVEAVISLVVVSVMLVAALNVVGASRLSQFKTAQTIRGQKLAEELMVEILQQSYEDPDGSVTFGCESGETTTPRTGFDDVDDYHGWSSTPPVARDGTALRGQEGLSRSVSVQWVDPANPAQIASSETGAKKITVTVKSGTMPLASLVAIRTASGL